MPPANGCPFERLTEDTKAALRLTFDRHMEAGEVARELATPLPTIRKRLERARQILGVTSTKAAARMLAEHEGRLDQPRLYPPMTVAKWSEEGVISGPARVRWWDQPNELSVRGWVLAVVVATVVATLAFLVAVAAMNGLQTMMPRRFGPRPAARHELQGMQSMGASTNLTVVADDGTPNRKRAVLRVHAKLRRFERCIADALVAGGELTAVMPVAAQDAGLSPLFGQSALENIVGALSHVGAARRSTNAAHQDFSAIRREVMDYGDGSGDGGDDGFGAGQKPSGLSEGQVV